VRPARDLSLHDLPGVGVTRDYGNVRFSLGDCRDLLAGLPDASVDAVVTDPPYELGFMGKGWDASGIAYSVEMWAQVLRVLKPGGHLLAFGGTRTYHRMACAVEDAGFEVRDSIHWIYGSGFPKSLDVSKAIDKAAGHWRGRAGAIDTDNDAMSGANYERTPKGDPITPDAARWSGFGTALKPAHEPIIVARKPLVGTVAANVLAHGTGAINVDGCRVGTDVRTNGGMSSLGVMHDDAWVPGVVSTEVTGRWPANIVLTHDPDCADACADGCPVAEMDGQSGTTTSPGKVTRGGKRSGDSGLAALGRQDGVACPSDSGGASRFFPVFRYCAKAPTKERPVGPDGTKHPTVKPLDLMRWLVRLVTPPGGVVLEPFAGSGTTVEACVLEGFDVIAFERDASYAGLIADRIIRARAA
jgi:hypothetical protein